MTMSNPTTTAGLLRRMMEAANATIEDDPAAFAEEEPSGFDRTVFWAVNGFLLVMLSAMIFWCVCCKKEWLTNPEARRTQSDAAFQARIRRRREAYESSKIESPEKRKQQLLESFLRHGVTMVVAAEDLVQDNSQPDGAKPAPSATNDENDIETGNTADDQNNAESETAVKDTENDNENDGDDMDSSRDLSLADSINATGYLKLPELSDRQPVPNCCAVCLGEYDVGDHVVWSSNPSCAHAFHEECILEWLIKMQPATPCPCCRQEFTDLETVRKEKKIIWAGDAFNFNGIALR